jgi:hypothetical protein
MFEKDNAVFNLMNLEKKTLNDYLKNNSGIRVYRDNMRVFNYGEPGNDWLGIDQKRLSRAGGSVNNTALIGSVLLQRKTSYGLREKTNREGFIEDEAFYAFVDAVRYALDLIVDQRNKDRFNLMSIYKEGKQQSTEPVIGELSEVITLIKEKVEDESDQREILTYLYRMEKQYNEVRIEAQNCGADAIPQLMRPQQTPLKLSDAIRRQNTLASQINAEVNQRRRQQADEERRRREQAEADRIAREKAEQEKRERERLAEAERQRKLEEERQKKWKDKQRLDKIKSLLPFAIAFAIIVLYVLLSNK